MRRADRLFQIVQHLRGGRLTTAARLAEQLEVSERTIYRDIADLQSTGVPIDGEAGVGYVMADGFDLPPLMFSTDEIVALVAGARLVRAWGGAAMAQAAEEALVKIDAVLSDDARQRARAVQVHSVGHLMTDEVRALIDEIEAAIETRSRLIFSYADKLGKASDRTVRPLGLWFWAPAWTLVAWCELRKDHRMFRLDRLEDVRLGPKFKPEHGTRLIDFYECLSEQGTKFPRPV